MLDANERRAYAGRWVALLQGRVAGVGLTAEAAAAAAQLSRPKEKPQVVFVPEDAELELTEILQMVDRTLATRAGPNGVRAWLVGGAIRDALLHRTAHDLDFAVEGNALAAARAVAETLHGAFYPLDETRDVGRVILKRGAAEPFVLDFARLRGDTLEADLAARDFTLNAMAAPVSDPQALIDPRHGEADLRAKLIRLCAPSAIADDAVRGVRAVRLAAKLNFHIHPEARAAIRAQAAALAGVSFERRRDEFIRCVGGPRGATAVRALDQLGLLAHLAPELLPLKGLSQPADKHAYDGWEHTLATVARLDELLTVLGPVHNPEAAADLTLGLASLKLGRYRQALAAHLERRLDGDRPVRWLLMLAALLHDIGKPATWTQTPEGAIHFYTHESVGADLAVRRLTELRFSNEEIKRARLIIAHHLRPMQLANAPAATLSRRAVYRFFRDTGEAGVDIALLTLGDFLAHFGGQPPPTDRWERRLDVSAQLFSAYFDQHAERIAPPPLVTGRDLIKAFSLKPGPKLGELLEAAREAQAAGEVADKAAALEYLSHLIS
jgi:putative nucleotidyltransferase with HDIG domain